MALYLAKRDGLIGVAYIHAGEVFSADLDRDPSWAERVNPPEKGESNTEEPVEKPAPKTKKAKGK